MAAALTRPGIACDVVGAIDQSEPALSVYRHNFPAHRTLQTRVETLDAQALSACGADLWWASPPCQPFTRRGRQRGLDDPRAATFLALVERVEAVRPEVFALENVEGFRGSDGHELLRASLDRAGYGQVVETLLCPSELGVPNRRPRFYLVASRGTELNPLPEADPSACRRTVADVLDCEEDSEGYLAPILDALWVDDELLRSYDGALHVVDADDAAAVTNCFTSAYGRSPVRSGSYLRTASGRVRRFAPREILRLLGFPEAFSLPTDLRLANAWRLVGNSLALDAVRHVLSVVPGLVPVR